MFMGIFFFIVCIVSQFQEEGIKVRGHIGLQRRLSDSMSWLKAAFEQLRQ